MMAEKIIEIQPELAEGFLGGIETNAAGAVILPGGGADARDPGIRTVLFTDVVNSTTLTQSLGDEAALAILGVHDTIVRDALSAFGGREIKHTGDGIMASFISTAGAVRCAIQIQRELDKHAQANPERALKVRVGAAAGEPVEQHNDLFGSTVQLASRLCAHAQPEQILVSNAIAELCLGKGFYSKISAKSRSKALVPRSAPTPRHGSSELDEEGVSYEYWRAYPANMTDACGCCIDRAAYRPVHWCCPPNITISETSIGINGVELRSGPRSPTGRYISLSAAEKMIGSPQDNYIAGLGVRVYACAMPAYTFSKDSAARKREGYSSFRSGLLIATTRPRTNTPENSPALFISTDSKSGLTLHSQHSRRAPEGRFRDQGISERHRREERKHQHLHGRDYK